MPRPTLFDHPKFHRLARILGMSEPHVLGHLEFMWRVGYSSGNDVIGDEIDVEIAAKWAGEPGALVRALADPTVRLIDKRDDGRYAIHDLHEHAPRYVQDRWRKEQERKKKGAARARRTRGGHSADKTPPVRTPSGSGTQASATPAPAPAPAHAPEGKSVARSDERAPTTDLLRRFDQLHRGRTGKPAVIQGGKDAKLLAGIWRSHGRAEVERLMEAFFASDDPFLTRAGFTVGVFVSQAGKLIAAETGGRDPTRSAFDSVRERLAARGG